MALVNFNVNLFSSQNHDESTRTIKDINGQHNTAPLLEYTKGINGVIKKKDVLKTSEFTFNAMKESVIPALQSILDNSDVKQVANSKELKRFASAVGIKNRDGNDVVAKLKNFMEGLAKEEDNINNLIKNELSPNVTNKMFSLKDIAIVKLVDDITCLNSYILDAVYSGLANRESSVIPKKKFADIGENFGNFSTLYNAYSVDFDKYVKGIKGLSGEAVEITDSLGSMFSAFLSKASKGFKISGLTGFNGNPIYHVRMWLVDREIKKYEGLKDKKQLIELKILDLKNEQAKTHDPRLAKQIEYYEDKVSSLEYDISKIENY